MTYHKVRKIIDEMGKQRFFVSDDTLGKNYVESDMKSGAEIEMTEDEEQALEVYSKNQDAVLDLLKREKKYNFLGELANTYGELAHEVNNRIELTKMMDPGAIAIAVQLLLSSFELIEKAAFTVKEDSK